MPFQKSLFWVNRNFIHLLGDDPWRRHCFSLNRPFPVKFSYSSLRCLFPKFSESQTKKVPLPSTLPIWFEATYLFLSRSNCGNTSRPFLSIPMSDFRTAYRVYTTANGDRRHLEVVSGKAYSAAQTSHLTCTRSSDYPPPVRKGNGRPIGSKWFFSDPEMKRRRRVAGYKLYSVEGKVKSSLRKGMRWIKGKCSKLVHGW